MKITVIQAFIVTIFASASIAHNAEGQGILDREVTLEAQHLELRKVLNQIEKQVNVKFAYSPKVIGDRQKVSLTSSSEKLDLLLGKILLPLNISYEVIAGSISLYKRPAIKYSAITEDEETPPVVFTVSGTVTSGLNEPLPGVNILEKGTSNGTATEIDGSYKLTVANENAILVFSFIGYVTKEIAVNNQPEIKIVLEADVQTLNEVVVVGYGTQERKDISGAISSVSAAQIEKIPVTTIDQALQGRSAGVQVTSNDGSPGAGITVQIRGVGSFGDNSPLYVVDGYPISGSLNTLNPNDIASMEILKDASSAAIYGSRAANGVVIITTKRGKKDGIQVSFDSYASVQSKPKFYDVLNAQQFASFANEVITATEPGFQGLPEWNNPASLRNIDWQKEMYQPGVKQNYNLAIRGGNDKVQSAFSAGYFKQKGVVKFSDFVRYNTTLNLDYTPTKWLKTSLSVKYSRNDGAVRFASGANGLGILTGLIPTMTGNPETNQVKDANGNYGYYPKGSSATARSTNVFADAETQDRKNPTNTLLTSAFIELTLMEGLTAKSNFGINSFDNSGYYFTPLIDRTNPPTKAVYTQTAENTFEWLWENTIAYSKTFGDHDINFVGGISAQKNTFRQIGISGSGLPSDRLRDAGSLESVNRYYANEQTWALSSEFARATYKLKDRYILTGTVRRDGSSRFLDSKKYGVFPSFAAAWRVKEEAFMSAVDFVSDLKIRGGWGETGSQNVSPFKYQATYGSGTSAIDNRSYPFGTPKVLYPGIAQQSIPNAGLQWEANEQTNIGLDVSFLRGKINFTADYYNRISTGFLVDQYPIPAQSGGTQFTNNAGTLKNTGLELMLGYRTSGPGFEWGISANVTTVHNKIEDLGPGQKSVANLTSLGFADYGAASWTVYSNSRVGGQIGSFYGYKSAGIIQTKAEIDALNAEAAARNVPGTFYQSSVTAPGDRKFVDVNGDGKVTDDDRVDIGSPIPKFYGGINLDATYKQFDIAMFWYGTYGNKILNYSKRNLESIATNGGVGLQNVSVDYYLNRWTETNHSTTHPRALRSDTPGNTRISDAYVEDGSYFRLRNIQVGYTVPSALLGKLNVNKLRIYVSAQNLLTFTKYSGLDPEIGQVTDPSAGPGTANPNTPVRSVRSTGIDLGSYPNTRSYTLGLNLQF